MKGPGSPSSAKSVSPSRCARPARERDDLDGIDPFQRELCRRGAEFSRRFGSPVLVPDHGLLIVDNWRMLHSRPVFRDRARHLTRYCAG